MDRTLFYKKVYQEDYQKYELDFLWSNFDKFVMTYEPAYYRITTSDVMRPDLVSFYHYKTVDYWWLLCYVNQVHDVFHDMSTGDLWKIPNVIDIYTFYKKYRVQN